MKRNYLEITDISDVNHLNALVCAWANKCVYYHPGIMKGEHVRWTFEHIRELKNHERKEVEIQTGEKSRIIIARHLFPAFQIYLTFLKFQDKVKLR